MNTNKFVRVVGEGGYEKIKQQLAFERKCIERKLYQKPPLVDNEH